MTLDDSTLRNAFAVIEARVAGIAEAGASALATAEAVTTIVDVMPQIDLALPQIDPDDLPGMQGMTAALDRLANLPERLAASGDAVTAKLAELEGKVAAIGAFPAEISQFADNRKTALADLRAALVDLLAETETRVETLMSELDDTIRQSLEQQVDEAGQSLLSDLEQRANDLFANVDALSDQVAAALRQAGDSLANQFRSEVEGLGDHVVEQGISRIVEAAVTTVVDDLVESQTIAAMSQAINTTIAAVAPQVGPLLAAVSAVRRALEVMRAGF